MWLFGRAQFLLPCQWPIIKCRDKTIRREKPWPCKSTWLNLLFHMIRFMFHLAVSNFVFLPIGFKLHISECIHLQQIIHWNFRWQIVTVLVWDFLPPCPPRYYGVRYSSSISDLLWHRSSFGYLPISLTCTDVSNSLKLVATCSSHCHLCFFTGFTAASCSGWHYDPNDLCHRSKLFHKFLRCFSKYMFTSFLHDCNSLIKMIDTIAPSMNLTHCQELHSILDLFLDMQSSYWYFAISKRCHMKSVIFRLDFKASI